MQLQNLKISKKIIRSKHIFTNDDTDPIDGCLFITSDKFTSIKPISSLPPDFLLFYPDYQFFDYENLYIFPGLIDSNVHLNSTYDEEWNDCENTTKMCLKGGITTIMDNPIFTKDPTISEELELEKKFKALTNNLYVDCGVFSFFGPQNFQNTESITKMGVIGFKGYLSPCMDPKMPFFYKKDLRELRDYFHDFPNRNLFIFHDEMASERDLFLCSPCRHQEKETRVDLSFKIGQTSDFGGGFHGEMADNFDSGEEEKDGIIDLEVQKISNSREINSPTTATLKLNAMIYSKVEQEKFVAEMEASQYSSINQEPTEFFGEISEKWVENDSELVLSEHFSDDLDDLSDNKSSCPIFNRSMPMVFARDFGKNTTNHNKRITMPSLNLLSIHCENSDNIEIFSSKLQKKNECDEENESPDVLHSYSKSPTKKESCLMLRRKKTSIQINKGKSEQNNFLGNIKTLFEKEKEKETKQTLSYFTVLSNHPICWENDGVKFLLKTFKHNASSRVLISNLSTAKLAFDIREEKKNNPSVNVYSDISIPYLFFCSEMIEIGHTKFKNSPPIREKQDLMNSIQSLKKGVFDSVSSYHLQVPTRFKNIERGNFRRAFSGNSCIGYNLQAVWTKLYSMEKVKYSLNYDKKLLLPILKMIVKVLCCNPAKILEIEKRKGEIKEGNDADFVVWDPFIVKKVKEEDILLKYPKMFVFRGYKLYGLIVSTFLRGELVYYKEEGKDVFVKKGKILLKETK